MSLARIVQVTIHDVVDMITMGHTFMSAAFTVYVGCFMPFTRVVSGTGAGVTRVDRKRTLVYMAIVIMMKMTIMHVINVLTMLNGGMTTTLAMLMLVAFMCFAAHFY
ncbi:MAG: hypothetical protein K2W95_28070 [Candidatus Obscuribacterales bacterium]|nr:hypothetical protein [Candidatus Obscuribacterales bacterium]